MNLEIPEERNQHLDAVMAEWDELLSGKHPEGIYHNFLARHAGLFLATSSHDAVVVSKLKLGADFESDFVIVRDNFSDGLEYVFVEIEVPHERPLVGANRPGRRLNFALGQINSWRQWIATHASDANNLLPSKSRRYGGAPNFSYEIYIGRRPPPNDQAGDLTWFRELQNVRVFSFDHLTSNARARVRQFPGPSLSQYPKAAKPALDRIDWSAISHRQWRQFTKNSGFHDQHLLEQSWELIIKTREHGL
jgi:hypothetical protein